MPSASRVLYETVKTYEDKTKVNQEVDEVLRWLDSNQLAEKEEYEDKYQQLQKACTPIMAKLHGANQQGSQGGAGGSRGPTVEEVD